MTRERVREETLNDSIEKEKDEKMKQVDLADVQNPSLGLVSWQFDEEIEDVNKIIGQIYFAFQEGVLLRVFSHCHGRYIPFCHLGAMERAMDNSCNNLFGSEAKKKMAINSWKSLKKLLLWNAPEDLDSLNSLKPVAYGYEEPRLDPSEFECALRKVRTNSLYSQEQIKKFERFIEMYSKLEKEHPANF